MKKLIKKIPILGPALVKAKRKREAKEYTNATDYWVERYGSGGNSGQGSYDHFAEYKGNILNEFVQKNNVQTVVEFGSGDGNQISYFEFPNYTGYEISATAIKKCKERFADDSSKAFYSFEQYQEKKYDLTLSLDVVYCLTEDEIFHQYMEKLFNSSQKYVIVFSSNLVDDGTSPAHIKFRKFTDWVEENAKNFKQVDFIKNKYSGTIENTVSDFYIFEKS